MQSEDNWHVNCAGCGNEISREDVCEELAKKLYSQGSIFYVHTNQNCMEKYQERTQKNRQ